MLWGFYLVFLPYHSVLISVTNVGAILADGLVIVGISSALGWAGRRRKYVPLWASYVASFLMFGWFIAIPLTWSEMPLTWSEVSLVQFAPRLPRLILVGERLVEADEDKLSKLFVTVSLRGRDLRLAVLEDNYMQKVDLRYADLRGASLMGSVLTNANLSGITADGANLNYANLSDADLRGAYLSDADLGGANLTRADLSDANLSGANLSGARDLTQSQLDTACGKPRALPSGLTLDKPCPQ